MHMLVPEIADVLAQQKHPRLTVVRAGALGDTVLILPTLELLHAAAPGARITLVGSAWAEELLPLLPFPIELVRFDSVRLTSLFGSPEAEYEAGVFSEAHAAVVYTDDPEGGLAAAARRLCPGCVVTWPVRPQGAEHAAAHFARAVADLPRGAGGLPAPALAIAPTLSEWARGWLASRFGAGTGVTAVHPGSGSGRKCWPAQRWADLIRSLGARTLLIEGPADAAQCRRVQKSVGGAALVKASGLSVAEAAALISRCGLYVGNDSGLSHVAAALGVPTVAVFGPTDPAVWAPLGPSVRVVRSSGGASGAWPAAGEVLAAIQAFPD